MNTVESGVAPRQERFAELKDLLLGSPEFQKALKQVKNMNELTGPNGFLMTLFKPVIEQMLQAELEHHLGYPPHQKADSRRTNTRNGYSARKLSVSTGDVEIAVPRDRESSFNPATLDAFQRRDSTLEHQIIGLYARGMTVRDIQSQLQEFYGVDISPTLISTITDKILELAQEWQMRPLEDVYAVVFLDAIHFKTRSEGKVQSKAAYSVMGIDLAGNVDVLGLWTSENEGAHFWQAVLTDIKKRGVQDIFVACIDGLRGFPDAIETVFPKTQVQLCVVHQIRSSMRYVAAKNQKEFALDLKSIYRAASLSEAEHALVALEEKWSSRHTFAVRGWRENWARLSTFFQFPEEIRRMIYTTNAVEALHRQFRKVTKAKSSFPTEDALKKMLYLAIMNLRKNFRSKRDWPVILSQLKIVFGDRVKV